MRREYKENLLVTGPGASYFAQDYNTLLFIAKCPSLTASKVATVKLEGQLVAGGIWVPLLSNIVINSPNVGLPTKVEGSYYSIRFNYISTDQDPVPPIELEFNLT